MNATQARAAFKKADKHFAHAECTADSVLDAIKDVQDEARAAGINGDRKKAKRLYHKAFEMCESLDSIQNAVRNTHNNIDSKMRNAMFSLSRIADYAMVDEPDDD